MWRSSRHFIMSARRPIPPTTWRPSPISYHFVNFILHSSDVFRGNSHLSSALVDFSADRGSSIFLSTKGYLTTLSEMGVYLVVIVVVVVIICWNLTGIRTCVGFSYRHIKSAGSPPLPSRNIIVFTKRFGRDVSPSIYRIQFTVD